MGQSKLINILNEKCDPELAKNKKLPYTAYLVEYEVEGNVVCDLVVSGSKVEIFDHYYDKYKKGLRDIKQSLGTMNPTLWNQQKEPPKKVKRKRN